MSLCFQNIIVCIYVKVHACQVSSEVYENIGVIIDWISSQFAISDMNSHLFILLSFLTFEHFILQDSDQKCEKETQVV